MTGGTNGPSASVPPSRLSLICNAIPAQRLYVNQDAAVSAEAAFPLRLAWHERLPEAGGEAVLPAGSKLADEGRPGRHCFLLIEGQAVVEVAGQQIASLASGTFVGSTDRHGVPCPPVGLTVRLISPARVLVLDTQRLAALIETDPAVAALWQRTVRGLGDTRPGSQQ